MAAAGGASAPAPRPLDRGRELAALFHGGQLEQLWAAFSPSTRAAWGDLAALEAYRTAGLDTYGAEASVLNEAVAEEGGLSVYTRTATFEGDPSSAWTLTIGLDAGGDVQTFRIAVAQPPAN